jgi:hypothetical protein
MGPGLRRDDDVKSDGGVRSTIRNWCRPPPLSSVVRPRQFLSIFKAKCSPKSGSFR